MAGSVAGVRVHLCDITEMALFLASPVGRNVTGLHALESGEARQ